MGQECDSGGIECKEWWWSSGFDAEECRDETFGRAICSGLFDYL